MSDISIRQTGPVGRITLTRPKALNALSYDMCLAVERAFDVWLDDDTVKMIVIDAEGEKAFCAGGDIQELYDTGRAGDFAYGRKFWADEYRLNAKIFEYPKPVVSFLQGFTMGGGVGVGCHGTHRIVGESSQIAMPEVGIGLVPDVGGSLMLALAKGRCGEYLGTTAYRMNAADAIYAGFADHFIPQEDWPAAIAKLEETGDIDTLSGFYQTCETGPLEQMQASIDTHFAGETLADILTSLRQDDSDFARDTLKKLLRNSPLSMGCAVEIVHRLRNAESIRQALELEYRFTYRAMEHGDFIEGIRAAIIDKDRSPKWQHDIDNLPDHAVAKMLQPLDGVTLNFEGENV